MPTAPGRNTRLENAWRLITGFFNRTANITTGQTAPTVGLVGQFGSENYVWRRYDQEYIEIPVRDAANARLLIDLRRRPEVSTCLDILVGDVFSSEDGDDIGFGIGDTLNDGVTPIDPKIYDILIACIDRVLRGSSLSTTVEEYLMYGDSFRSLILDPSLTQILKIKQLPTWEMFRVEDLDGNVLRFEQRKYLSNLDPEYQIHPAVCVHWRYRRLYKYGRSMFQEVIGDCESLDQGYFALNKAAMAIGVNPNVHVMPQGWTKPQLEAYKLAYENERDLQGRVITDFYMMAGGDVRKLGGAWNPDLSALIDHVLQYRMRIAMRSRIPPWMIGLPTQGARDIAGQPALAYARFIGSLRMVLAEGIRQILDLELALNGYSKEEMRYKIVFPKIYTSTQAQSMAPDPTDPTETDNPSIEDLDGKLPHRDLDRWSTFAIK